MEIVTFLIKFSLILASLFFAKISISQEWNWVSGDSTYYENGIYCNYWDNQCLAKPSSRSAAATWTDEDGNLWLFGGFGLDVNGEIGYLGDMWKYEVSSNRWHIISWNTSKNQGSNYGIKGVSSYLNIPSGRYNSLTWKDQKGNFWLYGGVESLQNTTIGVEKGDLWKYDPIAEVWTFVNGRTENITDPINLESCFGSIYVESPTNDPLPRCGMNNPTWVDHQGHLWFFNNSQLWRYNIDKNQWTWMGGGAIVDNFYIRNSRNFGTKGVPSATNHPGARNYPTAFTDLAGDLWLYGGHYSNSLDTDEWGFLNDLWKYSVQDNTWTWISGDSIVDQQTSTGIITEFATDNDPGARGGATGWVDSSGKFWLFGGRAWLKQLDETYPLYRNDLWAYDPIINQWAWMKDPLGFSDNGLYKSKLIPEYQKRPHYRYEASKWINSKGLWLFGGNTGGNENGSLNDLWCFGCDTLTITDVKSEIIMANVFTPDGDGINDFFHPSVCEGYKVTNLEIFNRWGEILFQSTVELCSWDGIVNEKFASSGVYFWKAKIMKYDGTLTNESGTVTLLRSN